MKRTNLALVKTQSATAQVAARPAGKDKFGNVVLSQSDIDRIPTGAWPQYQNQLFGFVVTGQTKRTFWQRIKARWQR
jgi:hypothetical protein